MYLKDFQKNPGYETALIIGIRHHVMRMLRSPSVWILEAMTSIRFPLPNQVIIDKPKVIVI